MAKPLPKVTFLNLGLFFQKPCGVGFPETRGSGGPRQVLAFAVPVIASMGLLGGSDELLGGVEAAWGCEGSHLGLLESEGQWSKTGGGFNMYTCELSC